MLLQKMAKMSKVMTTIKRQTIQSLVKNTILNTTI